LLSLKWFFWERVGRKRRENFIKMIF
jgi:hypothetical protein